MTPEDFAPDAEALHRAVDSMLGYLPGRGAEQGAVAGIGTGLAGVPAALPERGLGADAALDALGPLALTDARDLGAPGCFAHMDPPTPWITWVTTMWAASTNQNLLHPDTAPVARTIEERVVEWIAPTFGMAGGHMTPGSTIANLTALWAAREAGSTEVVSSEVAHLSIVKAAHLLGIPHRVVEVGDDAGDLSSSAVVITAGATSTGEIEPLDAWAGARWRHVDAAWAGPLRWSARHAALLDGIGAADSVSISAHKWLFQPKESALVLFRDVDTAHRSIATGGPYLAAPNVGVLGSHGAAALPLLATLLAFGRVGIAEVLDRSMALAERLHDLVDADPRLEARTTPQAGVLNWRPVGDDAAEVRRRLPPDVLVSTAVVSGETWLRSVAANPMADPHLVVDAVLAARSGP